MVARAFRFRIRRAAAFALLLLAICARPAASEPAFGDSNWVAPEWTDQAWYESASDTGSNGADAPGPRVAKPDKDPTGETVLRAPFRLLFLPLRLIARGSEAAVGWVAPRVSPSTSGHRSPWSLEPIITPDPSLGIGVTRRLNPEGTSRVQLSAIYGWHDRRRARVTYSATRDTALYGFDVSFAYRFRPNTLFYGLGNASTIDNKSYWLREEGGLTGTFRYGRAVRHEVRVTAGVSSVSARQGWNGSPDSRRVEDVFTPVEVPFLERGSNVYTIGGGFDFARLNDVRTPKRGIHVRADADQIGSIDSSELDYRHYHLEARGYVPAFSDRQSFALRALHDWVDPSSKSEDLPYYRLPETEGDQRFKGYQVHRFTDRHLVLGELEYRWWLSNKFYALLNASVGEVASTASRLRWDDHHESYGLGFRYGYSDRLAGRIDIGKGSEGLVMNFTLQDTF